MMAKHISIGQPVNDSEKKVFDYLKRNLPDDNILLTNLSINHGGHDYDFDAVVLGSYAIYAIEIKNYGGLIRGNIANWQVHERNGSVHQVERNPLAQAALQARILKSSLKNLNPKFGKIFVQDLVCLAGEQKPQIEIQDNADRLNKIQWYRGIEAFLLDPRQLTPPEGWDPSSTNISKFHEEIIKAIRTGFSSPPQLRRKVGGYKVEDQAWNSRRYRAYLVTRDDASRSRFLLKVYQVPATEDPSAASQYMEVLKREIAALRAIQNRGDSATDGRNNVVVGYDAFPLQSDHQHHFREYVVVMEWVEGRNLLNLINAQNMPLRRKYQIAAQICRGISYAHSAGIVHRDLNLKNIICDINGVVKIVNFDFAKFTADPSLSTFTLSNALPEEVLKDYVEDLMGLRKYVAPEIRQGDGLPSFHAANAETDLYALGVILYELFLGNLLGKNRALDLDALRAMPELDGEVADGISLLCSESPVDRKKVSLETLSKRLTDRAQSLKNEQLPLLSVGSMFGGYEILACLSRTDMSDVYRARETATGRPVALKFLRASSDDAVEELRAAHRSWEEIDSRYIAAWLKEGVASAFNGKILDGPSNDVNAFRVHYLVMEYLDGINLKKVLEKGLPLSDALVVGGKIIEAVSAIHRVGWTHRDIKPANIIRGADGSVRIVDFGLSQRADNPTPAKGVSPGYSPPELTGTEPAEWNFAGDVYSTASVVLSLLFGEEPPRGPAFDSENDADRGRLKELVGDELAVILLRDVDKDRNRRHISAIEMLADWNKAVSQRTLSMTKVDYNQILRQIEKLVEERNEESDYAAAAEYRTQASRLTDWLKNGRQGECPVDVKEFIPDFSGSEPVIEGGKQPVVAAKTDETAEPIESPSQIKENGPVFLSPEDRDLQKALKEIREHLNAGRLRQAVALAETTENRITGEMQETVSALLAEARQRRDEAVTASSQRGDQALKDGDPEQARRYYQDVLDLDPENEHVRAALHSLAGQVAETLSPQKILELRRGLRDWKNIKRLGEAVYEAEALDAEGKLDEEIQSLLGLARENYDQIRKEMAEETTAIRFADLEALKKAISRVADRVAKGEKFIFDITKNEDRPVYDMLEEANKTLEQKSADTAQFELDVVNRLLPAHPGGARVRLEKALSKPFAEKHLGKLEEKLEEINQLLERQKGAEAFLAQAAEQGDAVRAFGIVLKAQGTFPHLPGLEVEVEQARGRALSYVTRKMEDAFAQARGRLGTGESAGARKAIEDALSLVDGWPQAERPEALQALAAEGKTLLDFDTLASQIRVEAEDPNKVKQALEKLADLRANERFAVLPEMRTFVSEMDQYRDTGDQLREAREASTQGDWKRVYDLTGRIKAGQGAGSLGGQVEALYVKAEQEVRIEDARTLLDNLEVRKANSILTQILATEKDPQRKAMLEERLKPGLQVIRAAIENTPAFQVAFDRAMAQRAAREEERILEALLIFRYLGGISTEKPFPDLPDYTLTLRTDDARKAAVEVGASLREKCLVPIEKAFKGDKRRKIEADTLQYLARLAGILHTDGLIRSSDERAMLWLVELEWCKHRSRLMINERAWDRAIDLWENLQYLYPEMMEVQLGIRSVHLERTISEIELSLLDKNNSEKSIHKILDAIQEFGKTSTFLRMLAEAYANNGDLDKARRSCREAELLYGPNAKKSGIDADRIATIKKEFQEKEIVNAIHLLDLGRREQSLEKIRLADRDFRRIIIEESNAEVREKLKFRLRNELEEIQALRKQLQGVTN